ncbi:hypothetical protein GEMRC1_002703 [Eukaryota sp. GEM-RC1]
MVLVMWENGETIENMDRESSSMWTDLNMKDSFTAISATVLGLFGSPRTILCSNNMKVNGQRMLHVGLVAGSSLNGDVFEGDLFDNKPSGFGTYTTKDQDIYVGEFVDGKRHGKGKIEFGNGNLFEGLFENDLKHGEGISWNVKTKRKYLGMWVEGELKGGSIEDFEASDCEKLGVPDLDLNSVKLPVNELRNVEMVLNEAIAR